MHCLWRATLRGVGQLKSEQVCLFAAGRVWPGALGGADREGRAVHVGPVSAKAAS